MSILFDNPPPAIGCGDPGDPIDFACLFDGASNSELQLTPPATATNKFVIAAYIKRVKVGAQTFLCSAATSTTNRFWFYINIAGQLRAFDQTAVGTLPFDFTSEAVFRDFATPYQIIMDYNEGDVSFIVDGITLTEFSVAVSAGPGHVPRWNQAIPHRISSTSSTSGGVNYSDGYLSDFKSFAGESIAAGDLSLADFGRWNAQGDWVHKTLTRIGQGASAYGASGFHLDFADALDLGKDVSGNGNHFTASGLTVDNRVTDTPSNIIATLNPLNPIAGSLSNGNRRVTTPAVSASDETTTLVIPLTGKFGWRTTPKSLSGSAGYMIGVRGANADVSSGAHQTQPSAFYRNNGQKYVNGVVSAYGVAYSAEDRVDVRFDGDANTIEFVVEGVPQGVIALPIHDGHFVPAWNDIGSGTATYEVDFETPPEAPFKVLSLANYPCPEILNPDDYFTVREAGDVTPLPWNALTGKTLAVTKNLSAATGWRANDTVRGDGKAWACDVGGLEIDEGASGASWTAAGLVLGSAAEYQSNPITYYWRASPKAGFDIVEVNHVNGVDTTVPHNVGGLVQYGWEVPLDGGDVLEFHHKLPAGKCLVLNSNAAAIAVAGGPVTSTTNTVTIPSNRASGRKVLYLWRGVRQFSAFPGWDGTNNADGAFVPLDFIARFTHIKSVDLGGNSHLVMDTDRNPANVDADLFLLFDLPSAEGTSSGLNGYPDFHSNGLKMTGTSDAVNGLSAYAGACFARTSGKFAHAR